jgi:hypothetical protein
MLFPDLNLAEGRNCPTGSKPKAGTSSSVIVMVLPNKESFYLISKKFFYLTFTIQGQTGLTPVKPLSASGSPVGCFTGRAGLTGCSFFSPFPEEREKENPPAAEGSLSLF